MEKKEGQIYPTIEFYRIFRIFFVAMGLFTAYLFSYNAVNGTKLDNIKDSTLEKKIQNETIINPAKIDSINYQKTSKYLNCNK